MAATGAGVEMALERAGTETGIKGYWNLELGIKRVTETGIKGVSETGEKGYWKRG